MGRQSASVLVVGVVVAAAIGYLAWWLNASPGVVLEQRVTDVASERAAGTLGAPTTGATPPADIEGEFRRSDGVPGESPGACRLL